MHHRSIRMAAVLCMIPIPAFAAIDLTWLRPALNQPDPAARQAALQRFANYAEDADDYAEDIAAQLQDGDPDTRYWAANALATIKPCRPQVMMALGKAAADSSSSVRARALDALAVCGSQAYPEVAAVLKALSDEQARVKRSAIYAAGEIGRPAAPALPQLLVAAKANDPLMREYATAAIGSILGNDQGEEGPPWLADDSAKAVAALIEGTRDTEDRVRMGAAQGLAAAGDKALQIAAVRDAILLLAVDRDEDVRRNAALALMRLAKANGGREGSPATADAAWSRLAEMIHDDTFTTRKEVVDHLSDDDAPEEVIDALSAGLMDASPTVRENSAAGMAKLSNTFDPESLEALSKTVGDPISAVAVAAMKAIAPLGEAYSLDETAPQVVVAARSGDARIRLSAVETLGMLLGAWAKTPPEQESGGTNESASVAIGTLYALVGDPSTDIRIAALKSILTAAPVAEPRFDVLVAALGDSDWGIREAALEVIGTYGPAAAPRLSDIIPLTRDVHGDVRRAAVTALGYVTHDDPKALEALVSSLSDPVDDVRNGAADSLGWYGRLADQAVPLLVAGTRNPMNSASRFGTALGRIGSIGVEALEKELAATPEPPPPPKPRSIAEAFMRSPTEYAQLSQALKEAEAHASSGQYEAVDADGRPVTINVSEREPLVLVASWCHFSDEWRRTVTNPLLKPFLKDIHVHLIFESSEWPTVERHAREEAAEKNLGEDSIKAWLTEKKSESGDPRLYEPRFLVPTPGDHFFLAKEIDSGAFPTAYDLTTSNFSGSPEHWLRNLPIPDQVFTIAQKRAGVERDDDN